MAVTLSGQLDCDAARLIMSAQGISNTGDSAEELFRQLTGATKAPKAALGDALLGGHFVEVKKASSKTLNQVRAVKYIPLVAYHEPEDRWYVVPANEIVRQCARKARGQHTENPFESATLSLTNLAECAVPDPTQLRDRVYAAIEEAARYPKLKELMDRVLRDSQELTTRSVAEAQKLLADAGLS
jgi:hypothetical protein